MKQFKFLTQLCAVSVVLFLSACNNAGDKKADTAGADTSASKKDTMAPPPPAPVPAGPMMVMTVTHKVANYAKWKPGYDAHDSARLANGLHNYVIARGIDDSNMVMVAMKMDDVTKARAMTTDKDMKARMAKAGVIGVPSFDFLEAVMNDTTAIQQTARLMVKHKVKDWDAWKKVFDADKQARMDAGLTDRVLAHTVGDTHSVTIVFAVADVAKAKAFGSSKALMDKMKEGGVEGKPSMFFYKIAAKY